MNKSDNKKKALLICHDAAFNLENTVNFISRKFDATIIVKKRGTKLPEDIAKWTGDYIFLYFCSWIIKPNLIKKANIAALNFHPGPPSYPGTGCYNFALYDEIDEYGATCHHVDEQVDAGDIVSVKMFPVLVNDSVSDLIDRTYVFLNSLFIETILDIINGNPLPVSKLDWKGKAKTKMDLNKLCELSRDMSNKEIARRVRATTFEGKPGPHYID